MLRLFTEIKVLIPCMCFLCTLYAVCPESDALLIYTCTYCGSLTSPVMSSSFKDILPDEFQPLQVLYDDGNLRFSRSDKQSGRYDEIEYPIILKVDVEEGGEVISLKTSKTGSPKKAFKVGPDVRITDFQVGSSLLSLTGEFIYMP